MAVCACVDPSEAKSIKAAENPTAKAKGKAKAKSRVKKVQGKK